MGADKDKYKFVYDRMLWEVKQKHQNAKIVIIEPFIVKRYLGEDGGDIYNDWEIWNGEMAKRAEICHELAIKYDAVFVPLREEFERLTNKFGAEVWSEDCIHPTPAGHEVIAQKWLECCDEILV